MLGPVLYVCGRSSTTSALQKWWSSPHTLPYVPFSTVDMTPGIHARAKRAMAEEVSIIQNARCRKQTLGL